MLLSFDKKEHLLRFLANDQSATPYLVMGGFQRLKRWSAIPLKPLTFLYGPNSAGKGAVIDAQTLIQMLWSTNDEGRERKAALARWHRSENNIPLSVGFSDVVSLDELYHEDWFEQYVPNFTLVPKFIKDLPADKFRRGPQRLTWFASWETPRHSPPNMELFSGEQRAAAVVGDTDNGVELLIQRNSLEKILGRSLNEFEVFTELNDLSENNLPTEFCVASFCLLDWELSKLPTFLCFDTELSRDLGALLIVLFSPLARLGRYRSSYIGPIRRVFSEDELQFRASGTPPYPDVANSFKIPGTAGDGGDAWAKLAEELASEVLSGAFYSKDSRGKRRMLDEVNRWLDSPQCFDSGYRIASGTRLVIPTDLVNKQGVLKRQSIVENKDIEVIVSFSLEDRQGRQHSLQDVGMGFSQVIPVIIGALQERYGSLAFFEQPELHLHPKMQTILCDLFIDALNQSRKGEYGAGNMIIESHSEHLILRLQRRIRETTGADIQHARFSITPEDIAVLYFDPAGDETLIHHLRISPDGFFADRWPKGFFDERFDEIFSE